MPQDLIDDKSALVQVLAWCHQATSHYLSQCWPRSMSPCGITRPQWVNILLAELFLRNIKMYLQGQDAFTTHGKYIHVFFVVGLDKLLNKQCNCCLFDIPWHLFDIPVINTVGLDVTSCTVHFTWLSNYTPQVPAYLKKNPWTCWISWIIQNGGDVIQNYWNFSSVQYHF